MPFRRRFLHLALALLAAAPGAALAQGYPDRPVRMIVAFAPGGPTDVLARIVAEGLGKALGQQVVVENKAGAGGQIGTREAAKAKPDGYTILFAGDAALTVQPQISRNAGYDPIKNFTPLRLVASQANVLMANASKNLPDIKTLIERAKSTPGRLSFGSAGNGSPSHLIGTLFETATGIDLVHIPYKGAGPAMTDLIGGQTDVMFVGTPVALQMAPRKELVPLAVTGDHRLPGLPDTPTFAEAGVKGLGAETAIWWSVMGPAKLPQPVQAKLDQALKAALDDPAVRKGLGEQGVEVLNRDAKTVTQWIERDDAKWGQLIRDKKVTVE